MLEPLVFLYLTAGKQIPIKQMVSSVVAMYVEDMKSRLEEIFVPFKKLCKGKNVSFSTC